MLECTIDHVLTTPTIDHVLTTPTNPIEASTTRRKGKQRGVMYYTVLYKYQKIIVEVVLFEAWTSTKYNF